MMKPERVRIESGDQIPDAWGEPRAARRKTSVGIRAPKGVEIFEMPWGTLTALPGEDWVIVQDSGEEYPIKRDIFAETYAALAPGRYRKTAVSRLVQVPRGVVAVLATLEGEIEVVNPDYIVIGPHDEVYANSPEWVEANLEFIA